MSEHPLWPMTSDATITAFPVPRGSAAAWTEERRERSDQSDEGRRRLPATERASAEQRPSTQRGSAAAWTEERRERSDQSDEGRRRLESDRARLHGVEAISAAPAVVVLPGGAYHHLAEHEGAPVARWLNSLGIAAFVLHYRIAPHRHPLPLLDAARAVRWVRHHATANGVDPARVGVLGFSAGGHLAGLLATETGAMLPEGPHDAVDQADARPGLAVLCYPVTALTGPAAHPGVTANLLGGDAPESLRAELTLARRVGPTTPPMFLWHTADDAAVPVDNSFQLAQALARHQVPQEVHVYPSGRHGLGLAEADPVVGDWTQRCAAFLRGRGW